MNILFSNHFLAVPWIVCDYVRLFCLLTNSFPVRCNVWLCMVMFVYKPLCCDELCDCVGTFCFLTIFLLYGELCDCMVIHFTNQFLALQWVVWQCTIILFPNHFFCCTVNCVTVRLHCLLKKIQKKICFTINCDCLQNFLTIFPLCDELCVCFIFLFFLLCFLTISCCTLNCLTAYLSKCKVLSMIENQGTSWWRVLR